MECVVVVVAVAAAILLLCSLPVEGANAITFDTSTAAESSSSSLESFNFVSRGRYSFGYRTFSSGFPDGFGYGMGALKEIAFDSKEQIMYGLSEQGFVTLIDFSKGAENASHLSAVLTPSEVEEENDADFGVLTDIEVCAAQGLLFVSIRKGLEPGVVQIYSTAQLLPTDRLIEPELRQRVTVGIGPEMILPNPDCTVVAVANEAEGVFTKGPIEILNFFEDGAGSVSLITGGEVLAVNTTVTEVSFSDVWTDEELLELNVHLPLSENALKYWNDQLNFVFGEAAIFRYESAFNLEPEFLSWSPDGSRLYVSLQENNAMVTVDAESATATGIFSYGLKSWETTPLDVFEDNSCNRTVEIPGFFTVRSPDSMTSVVVDGETYILIANEGDHKAYGAWEERVKAGDIFGPGGELRYSDMVMDNDLLESARPFFADCTENDEVSFCAPGMRLTVGSSMMDYSNPAAPRITRLVGLGGRGISIYRLTDEALDLVWDSADQLEREGCQAFPWAHNGIQDERYAPLNGILYDTTPDSGLRESIERLNDVDRDGCADGGDGNPGACPLGQTVDERSLQDGPAAKSLVVGVACQRLYAATVAEKSSVAYLYDITNIASPELVRVFHLSPASQSKNPGVAYNDETIGEIGAESVVFLESGNSPTGRATLIFAGAWSGTASVWEFVCTPTPAPTLSPAPSEATLVPPTGAPVSAPTVGPTPLVELPSQMPSASPSAQPSTAPLQAPSTTPSVLPSTQPVTAPSSSPSTVPSTPPSNAPLAAPVPAPSDTPSVFPSVILTMTPSQLPSAEPSALEVITSLPTSLPTVPPTTSTPSESPLQVAPTVSPFSSPTLSPVATSTPTSSPVATSTPTSSPVATPTPTSSPVATSTPTSSPVATSTPTSSPVAPSTPTSSPVATSTPTSSPVATSKPTSSPVAASTPTSSPFATSTPTSSPSFSPVRAVAPSPNEAITLDNSTETLGSGVIVAIVAVSVLTVSLLTTVLVMVGRRQCQVPRQAY